MKLKPFDVVKSWGVSEICLLQAKSQDGVIVAVVGALNAP
jgi:hypothetical protein